MNDDQIWEEIERMTAEASEVATRVLNEGIDQWASNSRLATSDRDAYWNAQNNIKSILQATGTHFNEVDWMLALDVALDLAKIATDDEAIEAPYRALKLISHWVDWQIMMANGFNHAELMPVPDA